MTSRRDALKSALLIPSLATLPLDARAAPTPTGAVAGHFTHEAVRLWVQANGPGVAALRYWPADGAEADARTLAVTLGRDDCGIARIGGLRPDTRYRYRATLEGGADGVAGTFRTAPAPGAGPRDFRVYMGSCAYTEVMTRGGNVYGANHQIFDTMAAGMAADALPHFMLWMGDNLYLRGSGKDGNPDDFATAEAMARRYREVRAKQNLARLFAATHHYAIWDDHDFGSNNSDRTFPLKDESLRLFQAYWPNPDMGSQALPGTWTKFTHQDAEFFLLDNRWYRDAETAPADPAKVMFGRAQMDWLKRSLAESRSTFKVVAAGTQFLSDAPNGVESGWHSYAGERDDFFAWLDRSDVKGLVLLSGDRHNTQLFRREAKGRAPVHEFSCSPMTSKIIKLNKHDLANPMLDKDCAVETQNFGTLEFSGAGASRKLVARCHDADGKLQWTRTLASA